MDLAANPEETASEPEGRPPPPLLQALAEVLRRRQDDFPEVKAPTRRRAAGVLVLFYERLGELHIVFFKRTDRVPTHKGQVAFPGGSGEEHDDDLVATALREAHEELGIDPDRVVMIGPLKPFDTYVSNFVVSPFCGFLVDPDPVFTAQPFEVEEVYEIPLARLRTRRSRHRGRVPGFSVPFPLPYYKIDDAIIWGATGSIVAELLTALDEADATTA
jgi:8-oxo-dGTP pyrophosphatase MutT (NUDIX family)